MLSADPAFLRAQSEITKAKQKARRDPKHPSYVERKAELTPRRGDGFCEINDKDRPLTVVEMRKLGLTPPSRGDGRPVPVGIRFRPDDVSMRKLQDAGAKAMIGHPGSVDKFPPGRFPERPSSSDDHKTVPVRGSVGTVGAVLASRVAAATSAPSSVAPPMADAASRAAPASDYIPRWVDPFVPKTRDRSRSRRRRRRSPSSEDHDDTHDDRQVFRFALGRTSSRHSVQEIASSRPGALLQNGFSLMHEIANPTEVLTLGQSMLPQAARTYLTQVIHSLKGRTLSPRDRREMETLTTGIDLLTAGRLEQLGDLLMQRFKSLETTHRDGSSLVGQQQELLANYSDGATFSAEKELASRQTLRAAKVSEVMRAHSKGIPE